MTEEQPNVLCESVQMCIAVGDPLTAEQTVHLDACRACKAFRADMASLDEMLPTLSAGMLTDKKGQTVAEAVEKELALQKRFSMGRSLPKAFRHIGFAAAAVVVVVGALIVMNGRKAMKPANSAIIAGDLGMIGGTQTYFTTARDEAAQCETEDCAPETEEAAETDEVMYTTMTDSTMEEAEAEIPLKEAASSVKPKDKATHTEGSADEADSAVSNEMPLMLMMENYPSRGEDAALNEAADEEVLQESVMQEEEQTNVMPTAEPEEVPVKDLNRADTANHEAEGKAGGAKMKSVPNNANGVTWECVSDDFEPEADEAESYTNTFLPSLTLNDLTELAKKGDALTWDDFAPFDGYDVGSGLYIMRYDIDGQFYVLVGGGSMQGKPLYVRLCDAQNADRSIDVRTDDVEAFVQE